MGNILDFSPGFIQDYTRLGYLDTLKAFEKLDGIEYFYHTSPSILKQFDSILYEGPIIQKIAKFIGKRLPVNGSEDIRTIIHTLLPQKYRKFRNLIQSLTECAAASLNIFRIEIYSFEKLVQSIYEKYQEIENRKNEKPKEEFKDFFLKLNSKINTSIPGNLLGHSAFEYQMAMENIFRSKQDDPMIIGLENFFPSLLPAKIFFIVLNRYFSRK